MNADLHAQNPPQKNCLLKTNLQLNGVFKKGSK